MKNTICGICGKAFIALHPHQKYCCSECASKARKEKVKQWHDAHKGYSADHAKAWRDAWITRCR